MNDRAANATIRPATEADLPALVDIYNHYVLHTPITFDVDPYTVESRRPWFDLFAPIGRYRLLVAEVAGRVVGYSSSRPLRDKAAYDTSVEVSVYLHHEHTGRGLGRRLYEALFQSLEGEDIHRLFAGITLPNPTSIALHERLGFVHTGVWRQVGRKAGQYWDVAWMERAIG